MHIDRALFQRPIKLLQQSPRKGPRPKPPQTFSSSTPYWAREWLLLGTPQGLKSVIGRPIFRETLVGPRDGHNWPIKGPLNVRRRGSMNWTIIGSTQITYV